MPPTPGALQKLALPWPRSCTTVYPQDHGSDVPRSEKVQLIWHKRGSLAWPRGLGPVC